MATDQSTTSDSSGPQVPWSSFIANWGSEAANSEELQQEPAARKQYSFKNGSESQYERRRTAADIERADLEAARQLGQRRLAERENIERKASPNAGAAATAAAPEPEVQEIEEPTTIAYGWLQEDTRRWCGRKIRHRKTRNVYTIRQVFKSGRVEVQKSLLLFSIDMEDIRRDYETC